MHRAGRAIGVPFACFTSLFMCQPGLNKSNMGSSFVNLSPFPSPMTFPFSFQPATFLWMASCRNGSCTWWSPPCLSSWPSPVFDFSSNTSWSCTHPLRSDHPGGWGWWTGNGSWLLGRMVPWKPRILPTFWTTKLRGRWIPRLHYRPCGPKRGLKPHNCVWAAFLV